MSGKVLQPGIAIFSTTGCKFCKKTKAALRDNGFKYIEYNLGSQKDVLDQVKDTTGRRTVPQVFIGGELIGGSEETISKIDNGQLKQLVQKYKSTPALPSKLQLLLKDVKDEETSLSLPGGFTEDEYQQLKALADKMAGVQDGLRRGDTIIATGLLKSKFVTHIVSDVDVSKWLKEQGAQGVRGATDSIEIAQQLQQAQLLSYVPMSKDDGFSEENVFGVTKTGSFYRLYSDNVESDGGTPLNIKQHWGSPPRGASVVANELRERILGLYDKYLQEDGKAIDYEALGKDPDFEAYATATCELQRVDMSALDKNERMAFFINIYNALIIHATVVVGTPTNTVDRFKFFKNSRYYIGGHRYSADDIEHGILRGNKPPPTSLLSLAGLGKFASPTFAKDDPRTSLVITPLDPRIHFALVCGAKSCPPIKLYTPDNLETGLQAAAEAFMEGELEISDNTVTMSKILKWYGGDFGSGEAFWDKISTFLSQEKKAELDELRKGGKFEVKFKEYDWGANQK